MSKGYFCPPCGQVAVRRSVEYHLTDWFNEWFPAARDRRGFMATRCLGGASCFSWSGPIP